MQPGWPRRESNKWVKQRTTHPFAWTKDGSDTSIDAFTGGMRLVRAGNPGRGAVKFTVSSLQNPAYTRTPPSYLPTLESDQRAQSY